MSVRWPGYPDVLERGEGEGIVSVRCDYADSPQAAREYAAGEIGCDPEDLDELTAVVSIRMRYRWDRGVRRRVFVVEPGGVDYWTNDTPPAETEGSGDAH